MALGHKIQNKAFWQDRGSNVAAIIGVSTLALFGAIGGGLELSKTSHASQQIPPHPVRASGTSAGVNLEVSVMLDVTSSMAGDKISALKEAAKDLVSVVVWDDQSTYTSRVALVPFADHVRLPQSAQAKAMGTKQATFSKTAKQWHWYHGWQNVRETYHTTDCIAERVGPAAFTDAPPGDGAYVTSIATATPSANCHEGPQNIITPLTSNTKLLNNAIEHLTPQGNAAGHLGAAWAWYTLSPNWNSLWSSVENKASAYSAVQTQKIVILMSDGAFNTQYSVDGVQSTSSQSANGSSSDQARALCTAMKKSGIQVYTVGFDLIAGSQADTTLAQCASDSSKAFKAADGTALKKVFRMIGMEITKLNVSS